MHERKCAFWNDFFPKVICENIDNNINKDNLKNIDINMAIIENMYKRILENIDEILYW